MMNRFTTIPAIHTTAAAPAMSQNAQSPKSPSYKQFLENKIRTVDILLLDTSAIMKTGFEPMIRDCIPYLKNHGKAFTVLQNVVNELRYIAKTDTSEKGKKAAQALENLNALASAGVIVYRGNPNSGDDGAGAIVKYIASKGFESTFMLITQDKLLFQDVSLFSQIKSTHIPEILIRRLAELNGRLGAFSEDNSSAAAPGAASVVRPMDNSAAILKQRFGL